MSSFGENAENWIKEIHNFIVEIIVRSKVRSAIVPQFSKKIIQNSSYKKKE